MVCVRKSEKRNRCQTRVSSDILTALRFIKLCQLNVKYYDLYVHVCSMLKPDGL